MAYIYNIKSRDGSKIIATIELPSYAAGGTVNFDATNGIASFNPVIMNTIADTIYWMPNTDGFLGLTNRPNQTATTFLPNGQSRPLPSAPEGTTIDLYEAYEGDEAENGYRLFYDTFSGYLTSVITNPLYNVVKLPDPLPNAVKQTVGGGLLPIENWCYDEDLTNVVYGGEHLNTDTTLYAKYADDDITVNVYDNSGNTLKASQTFNGTTSYFNVYTIANSANLDITLSNGVSYSMEWARDLNQNFNGLAIAPNSDTITFPIGITQWIITTGTNDLYEVYGAIPEPTKYTITYNTNGGQLEDGYPNPETDLTNVPEYLPTCTKDGYIFDGWYYDASFNNPVVLGAELTTNTILYAKFTSSATIDIVLYQNKSENNRVNKKPYLSKVKTMRGTFRQSVNILNPTITIEAENLPQFNYVYISSFGRYYFVTSIVNVNTNIWQIGTRCDVLYSYAKTIKSQNAFVARNENEYNPLITDSNIYVDNDSNVNALNVSLVSKPSTWVGTYDLFKNDKKLRFLIGMQGHSEQANEPLKNITSPWGLNYITCDYLSYTVFMKDVCSKTLTFFSDKLATDLIYSVKSFPFEISPNINLSMGKWVIETAATKNEIAQYIGKVYTPKSQFIYEHTWVFDITRPHIAERDQFMNYSPYTTVWVEFMPFGRFEIDCRLLFRGTSSKAKLTLTTLTNIITGDSLLYYSTGSMVTEARVYLGSTTLSVDMPFSSTAISPARYVSAATSFLGSSADSISTVMKSKNLGVGIQSVLGAGGQGFMDAMGQISTPITSVTGGRIPTIDSAPRILITSKEIVGRSISTMGSPLYKEKKLNTLSGFTQVASVNLQGFNTATAAEVSEIEGLLQSGVIL